jgi:ArsR family transcriptional regulator
MPAKPSHCKPVSAKPTRTGTPRTKPTRFNKERFFQALGDTTRLRLLNLMGDEDLCVCTLVEILDQPQPKISRHLAYLRRAGIVEARREGKWMHYRIAPPSDNGAAKLLRKTLKWLADDRLMQSDRARLSKAVCPPSSLVTLQSVPAPTAVARTRTRKAR